MGGTNGEAHHRLINLYRTAIDLEHHKTHATFDFKARCLGHCHFGLLDVVEPVET